MLISELMERTEQTTAAENMANRLADKVRNIWLENRHKGQKKWEENFYEDPDGIYFLRSESFPNLQGIDYIFKWWGNDDAEGLSGELEVLWKVRRAEKMTFYKTWIRFADRDFILGAVRTENQKREMTRQDFRNAFASWQKLYMQKQEETI